MIEVGENWFALFAQVDDSVLWSAAASKTSICKEFYLELKIPIRRESSSNRRRKIRSGWMVPHICYRSWRPPVVIRDLMCPLVLQSFISYEGT